MTLKIVVHILILTVLAAGQAFAALDADIISHTIPASVQTGEVFPVSVTVQNTSTAGERWRRGQHRFVSRTDPTDLWGPTRVQMLASDDIHPGEYKTFDMTFTAPATPGIYPCEWQMRRGANRYFGELLTLTIEVVECTIDGDCDDGTYCNGAESCNTGTCQSGTPVDCDDGITCTDDSCDENTDSCVNVPNDTNCADDGLFCNGNEYCDAITDCTSSGNPCPGTECNTCQESTGSCFDLTGTACIDDANPCTDDTCDGAGTCTHTNNTDPCDDGDACTTTDNCSGGVCVGGPAPDCEDGQFCNGTETCDPISGCQPGTPVDCPDDVLFCTGTEACDEATDSCASSGNPCEEGTTCDESEVRCMSTTTTSLKFCAVVIAPDTQTVESGETFSFSAVSICNGGVVDGTYVWEIVPASTIGSSIDEESGLYTSGNNITVSDVTEIIQVTDIARNTTDTAEAVVKPAQPVCETIIDPSAATIDSEESITFTASTRGTGCLEPNYEWQIATDLNSQINAGGSTCFYQAGANKTDMLHIDTLTVVDRANGTSADAAVTVYYGRIKRVFPRLLLGSRWIPLSHIIYIIGEDTGFNRTSQPVFTPGDSITTIGKIGFRNFMAVLLLVSPNAEEELIDLAVPMVNEEGQEVTFTREDALSIRLLPFALDEQENKPQ